MADNYDLKLQLMSYWRPGTGKGSGSHVDATVDLDHMGCPFVAGRMLKGLLRDAVYRTCLWNSAGWGNTDERPEPEAIVEIIFGSAGFDNKRAKNNTRPGMIRIGNATLAQDVREWLAGCRVQRNALFRDLYSTAINSKLGIAKKGSLRGQQVVVPLDLTAELSIQNVQFDPPKESESAQREWVLANHRKLIETALPLVRAIGAGRTRGLGRVHLTLESVDEAV